MSYLWLESKPGRYAIRLRGSVIMNYTGASIAIIGIGQGTKSRSGHWLTHQKQGIVILDKKHDTHSGKEATVLTFAMDYFRLSDIIIDIIITMPLGSTTEKTPGPPPRRPQEGRKARIADCMIHSF